MALTIQESIRGIVEEFSNSYSIDFNKKHIWTVAESPFDEIMIDKLTKWGSVLIKKEELGDKSGKFIITFNL